MKLSKHISILLASLLLFSNIGLALNVHYCHGEVAAVSFTYKLQEPCAEDEAEKPDSCCKAADGHKSCCDNDLVKLQDDTDNILVKSIQLDLGAFCTADEWKPAAFYTPALLVTDNNPSFYCEANAPPLFKLYCRYIFYA